MSAGLKRAGIAAVSIATMFCAACDNAQNQADKKVRAELAEARFLAKTEATPDGSKARLTDAAGNTEASNAIKAQAMAARAQAELDTAIELARQIDQKELELSRVEWGIIELAQQIRSSNSARAGYQKFDPKPIRDAIEGKLTEARGGPDKPAWFAHASSSVPTLAAITQEVGKLEAELAQKKTEFEGLTSRRTQLIDQAQQAASQSNALKGQESLAAFTTASNLTKQAGDLSVQIDGVKGQMTRLERKLAVATGQQAVVNEVITQLQDQITQVDNAWKTYETQSAAHQQLSARILGTPVSGEQPAGAPGGTIAQKAAEVERLAKEIKELRSSAEAAANGASDFFTKAYDAASAAQIEFTTRERENPTRPEAAAWKGIAEVLNPLQYRLQQARTQRVLGELHASEAASAGALIEVRDTVRTALEGTGLSVPGALSNPELTTIRQTALTNAEAAYKNSDELLTGLVEGGGPADLKGFAQVNRALSFYGWAQVARQAKNETVAKQRIAGAMAARDLAFESSVALPSMPAELGPPPKKAAPASEVPAANPGDPVADEAAARATLEKFFTAIEAADAATAKTLAHIEPGGEPMFDAMVSLVGNFTKFQKATEQKFGPQALSQGGGMSMPNPADEIRKAKITITGDEAIVGGPAAEPAGTPAPGGPPGAGGPPGPGDKNKLVRKDGQWKLLFEAPKTDQERQELEMIGKMNTAIAEIADGITSGKYKTMDEVGGAFMGAIFSAMGAGGPGGPGGAPQISITPMPITPDAAQPGLQPTPPPAAQPAQQAQPQPAPPTGSDAAVDHPVQ